VSAAAWTDAVAAARAAAGAGRSVPRGDSIGGAGAGADAVGAPTAPSSR
jgi:hypothetical protein